MKVLRILFILFSSLYASLALSAGGIFESVTGMVTVAGQPVKTGDGFASGAKIETGAGANSVLRFEDGQVVVLNENARFEITNYKYDKTTNEGSTAISLLKGGLRYISGLLAKSRPESFKLTTSVATIGIRGTDFMAVTGSLYLSVSQGLVSASSTVGTASFSAGQIGFVSAAGVAPASIAASQLPGSVAASFSQIGSIPVAGVGPASAGSAGSGSTSGATGGSTSGTAGGGTAGGGAAGGGAAGGAVGGTVGGTVGIGAVGAAAGVAAAAAALSSSTTTVHH